MRTDIEWKEQVLRGYFPELAEAIRTGRELRGYQQEQLGSYLHTFMGCSPKTASLVIGHIENGRIFGNEPARSSQYPPLVPVNRRDFLDRRTSVYLTALGFEAAHRVVRTLRTAYYTDFTYPHPEQDEIICTMMTPRI